MGTRSLTYVYEDDAPVVCMYRQFDGYPSGHGAELAAFLASGKLVNGLSSDATKVFNGMCCLAAQMVAHFEKDPGAIYLIAPTPGEDHGQEYEYHVRLEGAQLRVEVREVGFRGLGSGAFNGSLNMFTAFCKE